MLKLRVATAIALIVCLLAALHWLSPLWWALLMLAFILLAAHEWSRLWSFEPAEEFAYLVTLAGCGALEQFFIRPHSASLPAFWLAAVFWLFAAPLWLYLGWKPVSKWTAAAMGGVILLPAWLATVELRLQSELLLLAAMALVWVADIAAYFAGRAFGRHKLAPAISPGKTWEGVAGAMAAVLLYAAGAIHVWETAAGELDSHVWMLLMVLCCLLCGISVVGDLFESAVKRRAGVKDSGVLLPGHGGVLDRIDALLPVLPLAALIFARNQSA
jgi:phosphatidate cytidylyltransferase